MARAVTKSLLAGECPHRCSYCYVSAMARRFPWLRKRRSGALRLVEAEFDEDLGHGELTIFVEHLNDLFARDVPGAIVERVLA